MCFVLIVHNLFIILIQIVVYINYICLLRPHREIRKLTWSDFSDDLGYIHLSGNRN